MSKLETDPLLKNRQPLIALGYDFEELPQVCWPDGENGKFHTPVEVRKFMQEMYGRKITINTEGFRPIIMRSSSDRSPTYVIRLNEEVIAEMEPGEIDPLQIRGYNPRLRPGGTKPVLTWFLSESPVALEMRKRRAEERGKSS